jgi:hypothetical protein
MILSLFLLLSYFCLISSVKIQSKSYSKSKSDFDSIAIAFSNYYYSIPPLEVMSSQPMLVNTAIPYDKGVRPLSFSPAGYKIPAIRGQKSNPNKTISQSPVVVDSIKDLTNKNNSGIDTSNPGVNVNKLKDGLNRISDKIANIAGLNKKEIGQCKYYIILFICKLVIKQMKVFKTLLLDENAETFTRILLATGRFNKMLKAIEADVTG